MSDSMMRIGEVTITRVVENYGPMFPADVLMPSWDPVVRDEVGPEVIARYIDADDHALASLHTWVVRTPQKTVLIDTCTGNHKPRALEDLSMLDTDWLDQLVVAGVQPDEVDTVVCTHLHVDHVGWNTTLADGEWVPTFPNARYIVNKTEYEFWNPAETDQTGREVNANVIEDSVLPVFDRGLIDLWDGNDHPIDDHLHLELRPGHTPGHAAVWLESGGERALFSGDSMHSPVQVYRPQWSSGFCIDPAASAETRQKVLEDCVEHNAVLLPAHFSAPHAFKVVEQNGGFAPVAAL